MSAETRRDPELERLLDALEARVERNTECRADADLLGADDIRRDIHALFAPRQVEDPVVAAFGDRSGAVTVVRSSGQVWTGLHGTDGWRESVRVPGGEAP